jgi:hypothetical protein
MERGSLAPFLTLFLGRSCSVHPTFKEWGAMLYLLEGVPTSIFGILLHRGIFYFHIHTIRERERERERACYVCILALSDFLELQDVPDSSCIFPASALKSAISPRNPGSLY